MLSAIGVAAISLVVATLTEFGPLSPSEKVVAISFDGLFAVEFAIAFLAAMLAYGVATRILHWGGQYAILPRPKGES